MRDELVNNRSLLEIINSEHINTKYLPLILVPENVIAMGDIVRVVQDADVLLLAIPHQYMASVIKQIKGHVKSSAIALSLSKGLIVEETGPRLISDMISTELGLQNTGVLMGANLAHEVASDAFVESTVAIRNADVIPLLKQLFQCDTLNIHTSHDVSSVELCGALKNIVAMAAGFCHGLGWGQSTKGAVMRQGIAEMRDFCDLCAKLTDSHDPDVIFQTCGIGDVIASSLGGRNSRCAEEFVHRVSKLRSDPTFHSLSFEDTKRLWETIESELLQGQKLQGLITCDEVIDCIKYYSEHHGAENVPKFPLFHRVYAISRLNEDPKTLCDWFQ